MKSVKKTGAVTGWAGGSSKLSSNGVDSRLQAIAAGALATLLIVTGLALPVGGAEVEEFSIVIPSTRVRAVEGSITVLATEPVGEQFAGQTCTVTSVSENERSIHPGNDLIVASGDSVVVLEEVESGVNLIVVADGELVLGSEIVISLLMGPDEVFSAGIDVHIDCSAVAVTTTTLEATTTTSGQPDSTTTTFPFETTSTVEDSVQGSVLTTTTVADEVKDVVVLPFTGPSNAELALLAGGALVLVGIILAASRREDTE